jgi:hypothetical protein
MKKLINTVHCAWFLDCIGLAWIQLYLYGVQGVASSNPAAPTKRNKQKANSSELAFCFLVLPRVFGYRLVTVSVALFVALPHTFRAKWLAVVELHVKLTH